MSENIEIIVGTYEQFMLGYKIEDTIDGKKLTRSFATHSHLASVRDVASNKHYLASAGADDSIYLYNMHNRIESGKLTHHNDTVNSIAFTPDASHILTCSTDGSIAAVRCGNWKVEKHWKSAHKGSPVNCLCIHPSGKLALSLGGDGVLRTWNLVKGRQAYATNLVPKLGLEAKNITLLKWSPDGTKYLIATNFKVFLYSVENAGIIDENVFELRVTCVDFIGENVIMIGHDNGQIEFYDLESSSQIFSKEAHDTRLKAMACTADLIVTASSSGELKLWRYTTESLNLLATEHCGARITCLVLATNFTNEQVKTEEIVIKESESLVKKKNVFKIHQQVTIEDEDSDEVEAPIKISEKSSTKSKRKSKNTYISLPGQINKSNQVVKKGTLTTQYKKKRKGTALAENTRPKLSESRQKQNDEHSSAILESVPRNISKKKLKNKRKMIQDEQNPDMHNTIDLVSPAKKKKKSVTTLKSANKVASRKPKKLKKMMKQ